jgi:hypothetical protein
MTFGQFKREYRGQRNRCCILSQLVLAEWI